MRVTVPLSLSLGAIVLAAAASACSKAPPPPPVPTVDSAAIRDSIARAEAAKRAYDDSIRRAREAAEREMERRRADSLAAIAATTERVRGMLTTRIHFDFDKSNIRPGDAAILDTKIAILQANPGVSISITGHCDERGSDEYNLALGNRRALAAREYLVNHGISADRITTASRGEEDPVDPGHNEAAWSQNRRDEFVLTAGGQMLKAPGGM
jgi:peptidoglycan-associated lipoprotein